MMVNLLGQDRERCRVMWRWEIDDPTPPVERGHLTDDPESL